MKMIKILISNNSDNGSCGGENDMFYWYKIENSNFAELDWVDMNCTDKVIFIVLKSLSNRLNISLNII